MFFSAMAWWMWANGEKDESLIALATALGLIEGYAELTALWSLFH